MRLSPNEIDSFKKHVEAIFATSRDSGAIKDRLNELSVAAPFRIRLKVLYSPTSVLEQFEWIAKRSLGVLRAVDDCRASFVFETTIGRERQRDIRLPFAIVPTEAPGVMAVVTVSPSESWRAFLRFVKRQYPRVVPVYLSQRDLLSGVRQLRNSQSNYEVRAREIVSSERVGAASGRRLKSVREWTNEALEEALHQVSDRQQTIRSITLGFHNRVFESVAPVPTFVSKVTKTGEVETTSHFGLTWSTVVARYAEVASRNLKFFSGRGLRDRSFKPAPLKISFANAALATPEDSASLVAVLRDYPHSIHAVQHGNPYVHVQIADTFDGSAFEIWSLSDDEVVIVPQLRSTEAAVERLVQHVFEEFREGTITDYRQ